MSADDAGRFERLEPPADLVEVAQVLPLDEVHHDVVDAGLRDDLVDADDVGVLQLRAQLAFAAEHVGLRRIATVPAPQHLDGEQLAGHAMRGAKHPSKRPGADAVLDLVVAEEEAGLVTFDQPVQLIVRQQPAPHQRLLERLVLDVARAELAPHAVEFMLGEDVDVDRPLGQLFRRECLGHRAQRATCNSMARGATAPVEIIDARTCETLFPSRQLLLFQFQTILITFATSRLQVKHEIFHVQPQLAQGVLNQGQNPPAAFGAFHHGVDQRGQLGGIRRRQAVDRLGQPQKVGWNLVLGGGDRVGRVVHGCCSGWLADGRPLRHWACRVHLHPFSPHRKAL